MNPWKPALVIFSLAFVVNIPAQDSSQRTLPKISDEELFPDKVLAKGKNVEVKQSELDDAFISYKASLAARGVALPQDRREKTEADLLDQLIFEKILMNKATAEDKAKAKKEADKAFEELGGRLPEKVFAQRLRGSGMTVETFREKMFTEATRREVLNRELKAKIKIPESEIKKFYEENSARFEVPEQVRASHILLSTIDPVTNRPMSESKRKEKEKQISEIRERAIQGEDFARLAKEFSEDPGSRDRGGEYTFGRGEMVKPFENAAFTLKPGEISEVVESQFGFHIIKLHEKIAPHKQSLEKVSEDIKRLLTAREFDKQLPVYFEQLKKEAGVQILKKAS